MHNYRSNQSAFMTRFGTDLCHQYGIFGSKSQTSFSRNATRAGSEEGWLFSQAKLNMNILLSKESLQTGFLHDIRVEEHDHYIDLDSLFYLGNTLS